MEKKTGNMRINFRAAELVSKMVSVSYQVKKSIFYLYRSIQISLLFNWTCVMICLFVLRFLLYNPTLCEGWSVVMDDAWPTPPPSSPTTTPEVIGAGNFTCEPEVSKDLPSPSPVEDPLPDKTSVFVNVVINNALALMEDEPGMTLKSALFEKLVMELSMLNSTEDEREIKIGLVKDFLESTHADPHTSATLLTCMSVLDIGLTMHEDFSVVRVERDLLDNDDLYNGIYEKYLESF